MCWGDSYRPWKSQDFIVLEGLSIFDLESITTVKIQDMNNLQSSKMTDPLWDHIYKLWKSQDFIVLESKCFASSISKALQQWKYKTTYIYKAQK